jgi:hypothetical protein
VFTQRKSIIIAAKKTKDEKMASNLSYRVKTALKAFFPVFLYRLLISLVSAFFFV